LKSTDLFTDLIFPQFQITNYTASFDLKEHVNLEKFYLTYRKLCVLEKELFPALKFEFLFPKVTVLLFHTGKMILTGSTNVNFFDKTVRKIAFMHS